MSSEGMCTLHDFTSVPVLTEGALEMAGYSVVSNQTTVKLNSGHSIPLVGLGTWKSEVGGAVKEAVKTALKCGYRHIDCAAIYQNEPEIGEAFSEIFTEGVVKREDVFVTSKLWNACHKPEDVLPACQKTLEDLRLTYLDLYLVHWPYTGNVGEDLQPSYKETWAAMEALVDQRLVRSIGVSNISNKKMEEILSYARVKPAVNQVEIHPFFRNDGVIKFCLEQGIHVTAYSPLGSPDSASVVHRKFSVSLLNLPLTAKIAEKHNVNAGQVLIRWAVQRGTSVLPKSTHPDRIKSNLQVWNWNLDAEDMDALSSLQVQIRMVDGTFWLNPGGPYRKLSDLWDDPEEDSRIEIFGTSQYAVPS